jgi:ketosteroid isomerase-like protein
MGHVNERRLRELYATFARGDLASFLEGCTEDVFFAVPGYAWGGGTHSRDEFTPWIEATIARTGGTFQEDIVEVVANDEHGVVLLVHHFDRGGQHYEYQTEHVDLLGGRRTGFRALGRQLDPVLGEARHLRARELHPVRLTGGYRQPARLRRGLERVDLLSGGRGRFLPRVG